jgi:polysaccharide export outer membrane protein
MVSGVVKLRKIRNAASASWFGLTVCLFTSWLPALAQEPPVTAGVESVSASKETAAPAMSAEALGRHAADYTVSPEDLLDVYLLDVPEVTRTYRVSSNGFLTLPLLPEPLAVAGLSLNELSRLIAQKFRDAGMLNNAQVTVALKETRLHTVIVSGSVRRPQVYPIYGPTRLLDVLIQAGGLADDAGNEAIITRGLVGTSAEAGERGRAVEADPSAREQTLTVNIRKLVDTGDENTNILLYPGDRVTVQRAQLVYVLGAVLRPGGYTLKDPGEQMTVLKALAMAGDTTAVARRNRVAVLRKDPTAPEGRRQAIPVNIKAMLHGQVADVKLQPDDILYVPESGGLKAMRQALTTGIGAGSTIATGLIIYH